MSREFTKAFWRAQVAKGAIQMAGDIIHRLQKRERILQDQIEAGVVSKIDILETAAALSEMRLRMSGFDYELQRMFTAFFYSFDVCCVLPTGHCR